jgi:SAM-dependent methyltransferase
LRGITGIQLSDTKGWDNYWTGSSSGVAYNQEGADHPALDRFWHQALAPVNVDLRILDVASGRGALIDYLPAGNYRHFVSLDYSHAALASQQVNHDFIQPVVADVKAMPFDAGSFDLVISQFGVEYGGPGAIDSLPSLVAAGGRTVLVMHCEGSVIDRECRSNREAIRRVNQLGFLPLAENMFRTGYAVLKGSADRKAAGDSARALLEPFRGIGQILQEMGEDVAGGTVMTLYRETARIQERIQHHVEEEVIGWIQTMTREIGQYEARMQSMIDAALSVEAFQSRTGVYEREGIEIEHAEMLLTQAGEPLAWQLSGVRP